MQEPDESLYLRYMEQRREADFRILFERHKESLTLFLFGYVHNMEDAEELMMDAYAQAAAGSGFAGRSSFKTWLFAIGKKPGASENPETARGNRGAHRGGRGGSGHTGV